MSNEQEDDFLNEDTFVAEEMEYASDDGVIEELPAGDGFESEEAEGVLREDGTADFASSEEAIGVDNTVEEDKPIMYRPPRMDLYTVLLVLSLIFVSLAATIHFLECPPTEYGKMPFKKSSPVVSAQGN